ncbi:MAG: zinc-ribbon domain-containing protein [Brevefilum sp.]|nr:zinc-ribbon domain-containing protein [Brevefilum sp.]
MMTDKIICPECGAENVEDAEFCHVCHADLKGDRTSEFIDPQQTDHDGFDLLNGEEEDLTDILHSLKQTDEEEILADEIQEDQLPAVEPEEGFDEGEAQGDEGIPDWLHRIRQRATEEDDSLGEITQKISAAKESLKGDKPEAQHENFESWIEKLRGPVGGFVNKEPEGADSDDAFDEDDEEIQEKEPDWLQKIRMAEGKDFVQDDQETLDHGENGLLNWLAALEDGEEDTAEVGDEPEIDDEDEEIESDEIDESAATREIPIDETPLYEAIPPKLTISKEERKQADQLTSMILDENAPRPVRAIKRRSKLGAARFFFAILLILGMSLSLFIGGTSGNQSGLIQPHTAGFLSWMSDLEEGSSILLVFDYQPAYASEINLVATPILQSLVSKDSEISLISSSISGTILQRQLLGEIHALEMDSIVDLGYFPIGAYGAFGLGMVTSANWEIVGLPKSPKTLPDGGFDSILILSDTAEGVRTWIEQLTVLMPDTPINLVVTAQSVPMLVPYFDSGQITGMVSGLNDGVILGSELKTGILIGNRRRAYQVGLVMLAAVMVIGAINTGNQNHKEGGAA